MVLNSPDAPWNAPEQPRGECSCGSDHAYDVGREGYPKWHAKGGYLEDCAGGPDAEEHRCCHDCAVTCRVCGCHYCPDHQGGFLRDLKLCEGCGAYYATFAEHQEPEQVEKLLVIDQRRACSGYGRYGTPLESEIDWLITSLKEAWEALAERGAA